MPSLKHSSSTTAGRSWTSDSEDNHNRNNRSGPTGEADRTATDLSDHQEIICFVLALSCLTFALPSLCSAIDTDTDGWRFKCTAIVDGKTICVPSAVWLGTL
ncbi:hypothetical protein BJ166DRAFT_502161 [Pestalotiopsis sp. NC0098]|nr:hypothetical protein BJ166DRAFT_502161 [Pestalotiopsis sp. NC0098]